LYHDFLELDYNRLAMRTRCLPIVLLLATSVTAMQSSKQIVRVGPDLGLPFSPAIKAGGFVYASGTLATGADGKLVTGDIKAQTKQVLDNLSAVLKAGGSSINQAASVHVYLKRASDFAAMNEVYRTYWQKDPPTRTTVVTELVMADALVEMSIVAVPTGGERRVIHPAEWMASPNPYSYGIKSGDTLFLSGLISRNGKDNSVVTGDIAAQTRTVLDNAAAILKAGGMSFSDVVAARVYLPNTSMFQDMNAVYRTAFPTSPPARATVGAGLTSDQYLIEITMTAVQGAREAIVTPNADGTPGRANPNLSSAIKVGNRLFVSGILGNTDANKTDTKAQTVEAMARIGRTLKAAGFDWTNVVDGIVYITDIGEFGAMNEGYRQVLTGDFPARATVRAPLMGADGRVELMFTAVK
jgi:2-iminobutanoate/2-iminopropanoate deaminase